VRVGNVNIISNKMKIAASQNVKERDYWLNKLAGSPVKSFFPYDRHEMAGSERRFNTINFQLIGELFSNLMRISNKSDNRLHMIFTTGLVTLLHKYTGNHDIIIGMPVHKQKVEGELINRVLPLRNKPEPGMTFKQLILEVRQTISEAVEHQNYPMETLVYKLDLPFSEAGMGFDLFDAAILLENIHDKKCLDHFNHNILFSFLRTDESIEAALKYNTARYEKNTAERIVGHFRHLFQVVFSNLDIRLADIDILPEDEKKQLLIDFNDTHALNPTDKTIHEMLEAQVDKTPDKTALIYKDQYLTYRALNEKSNRLARLLREKGVKPDEIVAVLLKPSLELIVAIAGILKAGGAYLPIDPGYPAKRISSILKDTGVSILLGTQYTTNTTAVYDKGLQANTPQVVLLEQVWADLEHFSGINPDHINQPGDLFYMISTSGSTGAPKSFMMEHRNLANLFYFEFLKTPVEFKRVLQFASIGFDVSIQEIFSALLSGGELYLIDSETKQDVYRLLELMRKNYLNVIFWPPAFLKYVFSEPDYRARFPVSIEHIIVAGEQLIITEPIRRYIKENHVYVHNHYGPGETHAVTTFVIDPTGSIPELPPIGKPISNTTIYIMDKNMKPVPIGLYGEVYINGAATGRGYLNRPELTAEKFKENRSYGSYRTYILYRTGDLARWLPDGNIEFIGRADYQVKIRGYRIELGEIENRLTEIDMIKEAVVIDYEDPAGEKFLCAYIVSEKEPDIMEIKDILAGDLPDYMIPAYFVPMERIPVNPSGKVDRKVLPVPKREKDNTYVAPRDKVEEELAVIWSQVLGLDKGDIGIDADFFELGGHSLKATILINRIHKSFDVSLTLGEMFNQPSIRRLAKLIKEAGTDAFSTIEPVEKKECYPLSSAQKRMYILQRMKMENISYNNPAFVTLEGDLRVEKFTETLKQLIKRHETLRTSFIMINREPMQIVHDDVEFNVNYSDLAAKNAKDHEESVKNFIRAFDLSKAPLLRVQLIKTGDKQHIVMYDLHHIITDGTSMQVFIREFLALYAGNRLSPLRVQYRDFSEWQNRLFDSGEVRKQQEYWQKQLEGEIPVLNIPADYPRPEIRRFEGDSVQFELGSDTARTFNELVKEQGITLYMLLLAIYNVLLSRLSGQDDIIIGSSTAGRRHADLHFIIGMFVDTLAMRNYPTGQKTFRDFLDEVKERTLASFENQDYPFDELVDRVAVKRDTSRNPLFDVMFVLQNIAVQSGTIPEAQIPELKIAPYQLKNQSILNVSKFDMSLTAVEAGDRLLCTYEYCTALFKKETIERFITYFKRLAADIRENLDKSIWEIEIISAEEKHRLLIEFNQTRFAYPGDKTIHELFVEQVERTPENIALHGCMNAWMHEEGYITYGELNKRADRLAYVLKEKGVLADGTIGIMMERSVEMIIGILGILKAGSAYLPIDPDYPQERIDYMLKDSGAKLSVTTDNLEAPDFPLLPATGHRQPATSLAYVIYTSGSTGRPKGVLIQHRGVVNLVYFHRSVFEENLRSRISQVASSAFDAMVFELWPCLLAGACLCIIDNETRSHPRRLKEWLIRHQVTISFQPTMMAQELLEEPWPESGVALNALRTAGEKLTRYPTRSYPFRFYNLYGPTEDTVWTTWAEIFVVNSAENLTPPSIGRPVANKQVYILSSNLKPQPVGVVGELCISGNGLARGYLNRPELTAEKFISAPASSTSSNSSWGLRLAACSCRLYLTGDLARWLPEGNIEFTGRIDQQVKIRGFRIETGEIENRLMAHDSVKSALVIAREQKEEKYLCAYIIPEKSFDLSQLKDFLFMSVPGYMVPAYFVEIDEIPLTPGGKVDRKALPEPEITSGEAYVPPGDEIEERLADIWAEILGLEKGKIGINDDFFKIGGHSLKAAAVISTIQKELNVDVPLVEIFRSSTIKQLARTIRENESDGFLLRDENLILLKKQDRDARHLFLVHDGSGEVEGYIEFCRYLNIDFNCWGIRADTNRNENYGPENLTIEDTAAKYIEKIKNLQTTGPYFIAGWSLGGTIAFEIVNQLEQKEEEVGVLALIDSPPPRQANAAIGVQRFSLDTEKKFVSRYLSPQEIEKIMGNVKDIHDFWAHTAAYLETEHFDVQSIRQVVMEYEAHVVPNYHGLEVRQSVKYLNIGRTFHNARAMYTPARKIRTPVHYFAAAKSGGVIVNEYWNDHCRKPVKSYEIPGDHYSIFRKPEVLHFVEWFGKALE
jgi:amino acid adenylation domain-containing protein